MPITILTNLQLLAFPNNSELKSIPECIKDLKELVFLNVRDCNPNIHIPQGLKDVLEDEGMGFYYLNN